MWFLNAIKDIAASIKWFWIMIAATFTNEPIKHNECDLNGFSWRKIAGLAALTIAGNISLNHVDTANFLSLVAMWLTFTAVSIGLITIPQLIQSIQSIKSTGTTAQPQ